MGFNHGNSMASNVLSPLGSLTENTKRKVDCLKDTDMEIVAHPDRYLHS